MNYSTSFLVANRDASMQVMLRAEGHARKSDYHNQKAEEEIPGLYCIVLFLGTILQQSQLRVQGKC